MNGEAASGDGFEALYRNSDDPWGVRDRWYEVRKRELTLACLPARSYASAYEPGCGNGELSAGLASRCGRLLASDGNLRAVELARKRTQECPNVRVVRHAVPDDWPEAHFDLIVFSEIAYFLDAAALAKLCQCARDAIGATGIVVACNWRAAIEGWGHSGEEVHHAIETQLGLPSVFDYRDADFLIGGWSHDIVSPAMREGLRGGLP